MKSFTLLLLSLLFLISCELPNIEVQPPIVIEDSVALKELPLIENLYEEIRYNERTDLNYIRTTASLPNAYIDSLHISYVCNEGLIQRKTSATYVLFYEVQVPCKSALTITYTFYAGNKDTTVTNTYPGFLFTPEN